MYRDESYQCTSNPSKEVASGPFAGDRVSDTPISPACRFPLVDVEATRDLSLPGDSVPGHCKSGRRIPDDDTNSSSGMVRLSRGALGGECRNGPSD